MKFKNSNDNPNVSIVKIAKHLGYRIYRGNKIKSPVYYGGRPCCILNVKENRYKNTFKDFGSGAFGGKIKLVQFHFRKNGYQSLSFSEAKIELKRIEKRIQNKQKTTVNNISNN